MFILYNDYCILRARKVSGSILGQVIKLKTEKLAPVASLVSIHHLMSECGIMFICGMVLQCAGTLNQA